MLERLEVRRLLNTDPWGASATVMNQDKAAADYPTITGAGVTIAMMDTGVDYTNPALGGAFGPGHKVKGGWDFVDNDADPMDTFGHGTNTAGIVAADNFSFQGNQYQGLAPGASIVALRIAAGGETVPNSRIEQALQWIEDNAATEGISIVNFSFGAGRYLAAQTDPTLSDNFQRLADMGILFVCPTGNDPSQGLGINYPAADPNVVAVGSISTADQISSFTQRGPTMDILAPGENVGTAVKGGGFTIVTLSSFSAPVIAGTAALMKQADPSLKWKDMLSALRSSGHPIADNTGGVAETYPRVDVDAAITLAFRRKPDANTTVGNTGAANDLAFDREGVLHFAYYDQAAHTIKYATRNTDGAWSAVTTIDSSGNDVGAHLSLAIDSTGRPSMAYYDGTLGDLEYARYDGTWKRSTLDAKNIAGQFPSLAFAADRNPVIAYYRKTSGDLRVMKYDGTQWQRWEVDTADDTGHFASLNVSKAGTIGVAYGDKTTGDLRYAQFDGSNSWSTETVDDLNVIAWPSLAYDSANKPAISYYDAYPADLKYASKSSGSWQTTTIGRKGAQGLYTNLWFDGSTANIVYFNRKSNGVFHVFGSIGSWTGEQLQLGGGQYTAAAPNAAASAAAYAWLDDASAKDRTADLI